MTFIQAFDRIKKKMGNADMNKLTSNFAVQVNMTDEDCAGAFYIKHCNGNLEVEPYDYRDHNVMITALRADIINVIEGKLNLTEAIESEKITVAGDLLVTEQLAGIVVPVKKAASAKKPADKKAPAAKKPTASKKVSSKPTATTEKAPTIKKKAAAPAEKVPSAEKPATEKEVISTKKETPAKTQ